jgi:ERCC4-type nuclease
MQTNYASKINSKSTKDNLTYINNLITGATSRGEYRVYVDSRYMDNDVVSALIDYGYNITPKTDLMGTFITYLINW